MSLWACWICCDSSICLRLLIRAVFLSVICMVDFLFFNTSVIASMSRFQSFQDAKSWWCTGDEGEEEDASIGGGTRDSSLSERRCCCSCCLIWPALFVVVPNSSSSGAFTSSIVDWSRVKILLRSYMLVLVMMNTAGFHWLFAWCDNW